MNLLHRGFCASGFWSRIVSDRIAPWVLEGMDIGHTVLEIGAGPGAATAYLRTRASRLTCIDVDEPSATRLRNRMARHHVTVLCEDATASRDTSRPRRTNNAVAINQTARAFTTA